MRPTLRVSLFAALLLSVALVAAGTMFFLRGRQDPSHPRIVVILPSPSNPFWMEVRRGADDAKAQLNSAFDVQIQSSLDMDTTSQIDLLNGFLARKAVDALVLGPTSDIETVPTVAKYTALGIPVISIDTALNPDALKKNQAQVAAFIGSDNVDGGRKAAAAMAEGLARRSRRVLLIEGSRVHQSAIDRAEGFNDVAAKENLQVKSVNGEWKRDRARELVAAELSRGGVDGIFASNDDMALGAVAAAKARGLGPQNWPIIVGFDATREGLTAVAAGEMYATVQQDAHRLGEQGVMAAVKALKHDPSLLSRDLLTVIVRKR